MVAPPRVESTPRLACPPVDHSTHPAFDRSDNAQIKWSKVCEWAEEFQRHNRGRQPLLWLDKACINQQAIEESLAGLPVYLAGCEILFITVGRTYPTRLWHAPQ